MDSADWCLLASLHPCHCSSQHLLTLVVWVWLKIVSHEEIASELLRLPKEAADAKAAMLMRRWNFPCTYPLGKHLAEQLVAGYHLKPFPVCIVRPSLVTGLAGDPYPGYVGNLAGGAGFTIAFAVGFFEKDSAAWKPESVVDGVPGDTVSSVVLAAAALTATQAPKVAVWINLGKWKWFYRMGYATVIQPVCAVLSWI